MKVLKGSKESAHAKNACRLLVDEEIRSHVDRDIHAMSRPVKNMVLTWTKTQTDYVLETVLTEEASDVPGVPERRSVKVGRVSNIECDALNKLSMAGRRLYFRLREDFPMLRRKLSAYKYQRI